LQQVGVQKEQCTCAQEPSLVAEELLAKPRLRGAWKLWPRLMGWGLTACSQLSTAIPTADHSPLLLGPTKGEDIRPVLIKPVCNFFCFWSERLKMLLWCGVQHNSQDVSSAQSQGTGRSLLPRPFKGAPTSSSQQ